MRMLVEHYAEHCPLIPIPTLPTVSHSIFSVIRGTFHGGDNDSTGTIASCWYGALYEFSGVYPRNHEVCMPLT